MEISLHRRLIRKKRRIFACITEVFNKSINFKERKKYNKKNKNITFKISVTKIEHIYKLSKIFQYDISDKRM